MAAMEEVRDNIGKMGLDKGDVALERQLGPHPKERLNEPSTTIFMMLD